MPTPLPCPRCSRPCQCQGIATIADSPDPFYSYQCDHCTTDFEIGNSTFKVALSFTTDSLGCVINQNTGCPDSPN